MREKLGWKGGVSGVVNRKVIVVVNKRVNVVVYEHDKVDARRRGGGHLLPKRLNDLKVDRGRGRVTRVAVVNEVNVTRCV